MADMNGCFAMACGIQVLSARFWQVPLEAWATYCILCIESHRERKETMSKPVSVLHNLQSIITQTRLSLTWESR